MHSVHAAAETFFTVSMAGSIFFNVSADAARPRVLLFLVLTMAPFLVMAPLVGPVIDRVRGGVGGVVLMTFVVRAVLAFYLAQHLRSLLLFPLAFGVLVVAKTYTVGRNALVPSLVDSDLNLVGVNARLSRTATFAGAIAAACAVAIYRSTSGAWTLRIAAVIYVLGTYTAWRVRRASSPIEPAGRSGVVEMMRLDVSGAMWDMMALRAAVGYALFHFAFSLRAGAEPAWLFGTVIVANGLGGFTGTVVAPLMRRRMSEQTMFTLALTGASVGMVVCGVSFNRFTLVGAVFVLGLAVSIGRRALDSTIQSHASHARRGRIYAGLETRLELAWVAAACAAVGSRLATWVGILALSAFLIFATMAHVRRHRLLDLVEPSMSLPLTERLVIRAETLAGLEHYDEAVVVALSAIDLVCVNGADEVDIDAFREIVAADVVTIDDDDARRAIALARRMLENAESDVT